MYRRNIPLNMGRALSVLTLAGAGAVQAVPIYESPEVTLYMEGYFSAHQVNTLGDTAMQDGASRVRIGLNIPAYDIWDVGFNLEWGVRAISSAQDLIISGDQQSEFSERNDSLFLRQGHAFAKHDCWGDFAAGKQWGVYYDVAQITDWYNVGGGLASGAFALGTDGGVTGTGRADSALTWRQQWEIYGGEFQLGLQYAAHVSSLNISVDDVVAPDTRLECPAEDCEFGIGHGISLSYNLDFGDGLFFGAAYNRVKLDLSTDRGLVFDTSGPDEEIIIDDRFPINASSNAWATTMGLAYGKGAYQKGFYGAVVGQRSQNNELAPAGSVEGITNFFDARGSESFFSYTWGMKNCYSVYLGHNVLKSDDAVFEAALIEDDQFRLAVYYVGFQYLWNERIRVYWENAIDDSNVVARPIVDDYIAVGIRVDI
ncbi:hypothetical protein AUP74_02700 [Microbulbifer aggregans]|uniref:Porin domain-containing protein n=1 Tax=Microbulbifer aggregans TaxID=1769779 RepID=A0A1C9WAD5_9GAMM|nr:porin [Microbulbifer aggregans]AOS98095.1 hypothetical protein AUP74_02700 [Microbulbifer aggregans]